MAQHVVDDGTGEGSGARVSGRVDRRTLLKRAAATGAIVWTAPVVLDSLASPAGALSCGSCIRFQVKGGAMCPTSTTKYAASTSGCDPSTSGCNSTTDIGDMIALSTLGVTAPATCTATDSVTFEINRTTSLTACAATREFTSAVGEAAEEMMGPVTCVTANITNSPSTSFAAFGSPPAGSEWGSGGFRFVVGCGC